MSTDRRELIAARLFAIAQGIAGAGRAYRNETTVTAKSSPAIVVWDGDEAVVNDQPGIGPLTVELLPEIRIVAENAAADIGATLNGLRMQLLKAVLEDATLLGHIGAKDASSRRGDGSIRYAGCSHALEQGRKVEGELSLNFAIRYPLRWSELQQE